MECADEAAEAVGTQEQLQGRPVAERTEGGAIKKLESRSGGAAELWLHHLHSNRDDTLNLV